MEYSLSTLKTNTIQAATGSTVKRCEWTCIKCPGHVIQTVQAVKTDTTASSSQSFVDISGLSVSITPASAASKFLITCNFCFSGAHQSSPKFRLAGGNSGNFIGDAASNRVRVAYFAADDWFNGASYAGTETAFMGSICYLDSPNTTSAITYKLQGETDGNGAFYINRTHADVDDASEGGRSASSITVQEIAQ